MSMLNVNDVPIKKQKLKEPSFKHFDCTCTAKNGYVHLVLTMDKLSCILRNYKIYMQVRGMWNDLSNNYKKMVERNINYPVETIKKIKLVIPDKILQSAVNTNETIFKLQIVSKKNYHMDLVKYVEMSNCKEFVDLINQHVYNDDLEKEINEAVNVMEKLKLCNF